MAFAAFAAIGPIVSAISTGYKVIQLVSDLFLSDPKLTLADIGRELSSSNAHYFEGDNLPILQDRRNNFYGVIQRALVDAGTITKSDLQSGGRLHSTYNDLTKYRGDVNDVLMKLTWLWSQNDLHPDDLIRFTRIFTESYAVLLHMQCVYSQLHCIEMDCKSLDDPSLEVDTLQTQLYLQYAIEALTGIRQMTIYKRLDMITFHSRTDSYGESFYWFDDSYKQLSTSTQESVLLHVKPSCDPPTYNPHPEAWWNTQPVDDSGEQPAYIVVWEETVRVGQVCYMFDLLGGDDALVALQVWKTLDIAMEDRLALQTSAKCARILLPEQMSVQMSTQTLANQYYISGEQALDAVCETSIVQVEWVLIDGLGQSSMYRGEAAKKGTARKIPTVRGTSGNEMTRPLPPKSRAGPLADTDAAADSNKAYRLYLFCGQDDGTSDGLDSDEVTAEISNSSRTVKYKTLVKWGDNYHFQYSTMWRVRDDVVGGLSLKFDGETKTFEDFNFDGLYSLTTDKKFVYQRVYTVKTFVWFCLDAWGQFWVPGSLGGYEPRVREVEWEIHSDEVLATNDEMLGSRTVNVQAGDTTRNFYNITRRKLENCTKKCRNWLYQGFRVLA